MLVIAFGQNFHTRERERERERLRLRERLLSASPILWVSTNFTHILYLMGIPIWWAKGKGEEVEQRTDH